ncbi:uncharacterized protein BO87DRAFT_428787 [Aspergillus neoniger CBS 115656]|uniref:Uncharacterized protein n=1 Tax=Aspergillus neoniger (strain CBS 115656) TaxID=1448310 RepID=A0A318YBV5_ASPNB|nr:hypothetical protein BO87DRAFT_428787 [Aspergillus neoniger CBS 115656]PYH31454.1 hypothetical protein BO87DRAFT_428787 [Aspergillus neoniger CBS 115656]
MAGTDDFVFVELPEAEAVVGACVNYVPVRVTLQAACTVSNLLHAFHEQQTRSMAFETIEHDDLLAQSACQGPSRTIKHIFRLPYYHPREAGSPFSKVTLELKFDVSDQLWDQNQADQTLHLFSQTAVRLLESPPVLPLTF